MAGRPWRCNGCKKSNHRCFRNPDSLSCVRCVDKGITCIWPYKACVSCRSLKVTCEPGFPKCVRCHRLGRNCQWPERSVGAKRPVESTAVSPGYIGAIDRVFSELDYLPATSLPATERTNSTTLQTSPLMSHFTSLQLNEGQLLESRFSFETASLSEGNHEDRPNPCHLPPCSMILEGRRRDLYSGFDLLVGKNSYPFFRDILLMN